jgi:hypothetical protein
MIAGVLRFEILQYFALRYDPFLYHLLKLLCIVLVLVFDNSALEAKSSLLLTLNVNFDLLGCSLCQVIEAYTSTLL